jgi:hypothetical protein
MNPDLTSLEADLHELQASALDETLLLRLEGAADGTWAELGHEEIRFENFLREVSPAALSPDFLAKLEDVVARTPFTVNEKIVLFPKAKSPAPLRKFRPIRGAAAAVALIGAATALLIPNARPPQKFAYQAPVVSSPAITPNPVGNLVPASFNRGLSGVSDEGIVWKSNKQPHSVVRVSYEEKITLKDEMGRTYQVVQPRVQYMLVPAKTD